MLDLYFGHLIWRSDFWENTLMPERLRAEGEGDDRGWDCWMASSTQWTWVWVSFGRWSTSVLQSTELQIVWHNWVIEQQCSISLTKLKKKLERKNWTSIMDWMCFPWKFTCWNLIPGVMVCSYRAFGMQLDREGGTLMNYIKSPCLKR